MRRNRRRNMFKRTRQPKSSQFRSETGKDAPVLQTSATHGSCVHFLPPDKCLLKSIEVDPTGAACKDFAPKSFDVPGVVEG